MFKWQCGKCFRFGKESVHECKVIVPLSKRIWWHIRKSKACWEWTGARDIHGYGRIGNDYPKKNLLLAHRAIWIITNGEIPKNLCVLHRCDNPPCVNPKHLFLGTKKDNSQDMVKKGRWANQFSALKLT